MLGKILGGVSLVGGITLVSLGGVTINIHTAPGARDVQIDRLPLPGARADALPPGGQWSQQAPVNDPSCAVAMPGSQPKPHTSAIRVRNPGTGACSWYVPGVARPTGQPYALAPSPQIEGGINYTGRSCTRSDGATGREGYSGTQLGCWRY
jgi:hypothetical protein